MEKPKNHTVMVDGIRYISHYDFSLEMKWRREKLLSSPYLITPYDKYPHYKKGIDEQREGKTGILVQSFKVDSDMWIPYHPNSTLDLGEKLFRKIVFVGCIGQMTDLRSYCHSRMVGNTKEESYEEVHYESPEPLKEDYELIYQDILEKYKVILPTNQIQLGNYGHISSEMYEKYRNLRQIELLKEVV